jgi:asparagine synthase (glutamine-hydrolysing)
MDPPRPPAHPRPGDATTTAESGAPIRSMGGDVAAPPAGGLPARIAGLAGRPGDDRTLAAAAERMRSAAGSLPGSLPTPLLWLGPAGEVLGCGPGELGRIVAVLDGEAFDRSGDGSSGMRLGDGELIRRYRQEGAGFLERLGGSFALALYDPAERRLLLARDRFGAKPLYWRRLPDGLAFSSAIAPLLAAEPTPPRPDLEAVDQALVLGWVPAPRTGFAGIQKLPPGGRLVWRDGRIETDRFWWLGFDRPRPPLDPERALDRLESVLDESVGSRLESARRPGLWLSGGLDSSYLAALAAEHSGATPVTLTARDPGARDDEGVPAREMARRIGSEHHEIVLRAEELLTGLDAAVAVNEEPWSASPAAVIAALAEGTARAGCDLVLTGDGADELFSGGHSRLHLAALAALRSTVPRGWAAARAARARTAVARNRWLAVAADDEHLAELESSRRLVRSERERIVRAAHRLAPGGPPAIRAARLPDEILRGCRDAVDRRTAFDLVGRMAECLLPESDKQLVSRGLRLATPYLADACVDLVLSLPGSVRLGYRRPKRLLASLAARRLPRSLHARPKVGLRHPPELISLLASRLREDGGDTGLFDGDGLRRWLGASPSGERDSRALVTVYTVGRWWRIHFT